MVVLAAELWRRSATCTTNGRSSTAQRQDRDAGAERRPKRRPWRRAAARSWRSGSNQAMDALMGPSTRVIDLHGRLAIPGFIEGHGHFTALGASKMSWICAARRIGTRSSRWWRRRRKKAKPGTWILGSGFHQAKWDHAPEPNVRGFPVHESLSRVSPRNPVWLTHASGHAGFANAEAMRLAGVDKRHARSGGRRDLAGSRTAIRRD